MLLRLLTAIVGATVVTAVLLLGMDAITTIFREGDTGQYFRIDDVQRRPQGGRPDRPEAAEPQPDIESQDFGPLESPLLEAAEPEPAIEAPPAELEGELSLPELDGSE